MDKIKFNIDTPFGLDLGIEKNRLAFYLSNELYKEHMKLSPGLIPLNRHKLCESSALKIEEFNRALKILCEIGLIEIILEN